MAHHVVVINTTVAAIHFNLLRWAKLINAESKSAKFNKLPNVFEAEIYRITVCRIS